MKEKILYWLQPLLLPFYALEHLLPRDKRLWVFGSSFGKRFADNPRYLFLYLSHLKRRRIKPVWISADPDIVRFLRAKGLTAYHRTSAAGRLCALQAGVYIYDNYSKDINFWLSGGALKINLWHGVGNKRINHDNIHDRVRHPENLWERISTFPRRISDEKPTDYVLCTSRQMGRYFEKAFRLKPHHVICDGYPRCDALFDERFLKVLTGDEKSLQKTIEGRGAKRVIAYLPTFRESETKLFDVMDMGEFDEFLGQRDYLLLVKPHPKSAIKERLGEGEYKNVIMVPADVDVYTFLGRADMLVTDYSSVYTDYMLLDRPVVAFTYDEEEYLQNSRDYFIDQREYMPERRAADMKELMAQIDEAFADDQCKEARLKSRERMFDIPGPGACGRVYRSILKLAGICR